MNKPRVIAFYLPQFYPTPENDKWWQPGFTEWTNVTQARPLFHGHYQPHIPRDLGFYDLRVPETRYKQAELAKNAGIEGFCYWHYWFNGKRLLDQVFNEIVSDKNYNYPFCLCWANHSWYKKTWDPSKGKDQLLIEQTYPGIEDYKNHFYAMLPAFKDDRYLKVNGKLLFGVYAPLDIPDSRLFIETWQRLAIENGLEGFYFFGFALSANNENKILKNGFDAVVTEYLLDFKNNSRGFFSKVYGKIEKNLRGIIPFKPFDYLSYCKYLIKNYKADNAHHACISPNYDHSPRSKLKGIILHNSTPKKWSYLCDGILRKISKRDEEGNLLFIKAWNEWGEGNHLEPDIKYGLGFLDVLSELLCKEKKD